MGGCLQWIAGQHDQIRILTDRQAAQAIVNAQDLGGRACDRPQGDLPRQSRSGRLDGGQAEIRQALTDRRSDGQLHKLRTEDCKVRLVQRVGIGADVAARRQA